MIDFSKCNELGAKNEGAQLKTSVLYNDEEYMIKFSDLSRYGGMNSKHIAEHVGSSIFSSCGIKSQETIVGIWTDDSGKQLPVVACKDFTQNGDRLVEIVKVKNQYTSLSSGVIDNSVKMRQGINITDVDIIIQNSKMPMDKNLVMDCFWDMFVVDALIANGDRHLGNWGILIDKDKRYHFAPIYDCGSALAGRACNKMMELAYEDEKAFDRYERNALSLYKSGRGLIKYLEIFRSPPRALSEAVLRIVPRISVDTISGIIKQTPGISDICEAYLNKAIKMRYEQIIEPAYRQLVKTQNLRGVKQKGYVEKPPFADVLNIAKKQVYEHNNSNDKKKGKGRPPQR